MATIQLGNTKVANKLISYCEKKAVEREGINCSPEYAKSQFKATRELWGKPQGIQAHHVIQSFKPGEVTPKLANQIGKDLAEKIGKGYEAVIYTHADKRHIHNHIVINSVSYEDGKKLHLHKAIDKVRGMSDQFCKEKGLSIVKEPSAKERYHRAEYGLAKRGQMSWKDEIREAIKHEKLHSKTYENFKKNLTEKYGIEVKERGKHINFKHPDCQKFVRGKTLGLDYERGTIEDGFSRQIERESRGESSSSDILLKRNRERHYINNSGAGIIDQSNQQEHGREQNRQGESSQKIRREREETSRNGSQIERDIQGSKTRNVRPQSYEPTRDGKDIQSYARGNTQDRGQSQGNDKTDKGYGIHSKADTKPIMEGKSETIRNPIANNNGINAGISRSIPTGEPFGAILQSLSSAIKKADNIAKTEQQKSYRKEQVKTKIKDRARGFDR